MVSFSAHHNKNCGLRFSPGGGPSERRLRKASTASTAENAPPKMKKTPAAATAFCVLSSKSGLRLRPRVLDARSAHGGGAAR